MFVGMALELMRGVTVAEKLRQQLKKPGLLDANYIWLMLQQVTILSCYFPSLIWYQKRSDAC